ncbi:MAG: hypothetical protein Q4C34_07415 [Bacteroidales bacterium]|nr:hypothetical protein [Bacteroidales bacterium]
MSNSLGVEFAPVVERLLSQINDVCQKAGNNVDVKKIINPLLDQLGFMPARRKRTAAPKLELPDDIINSIKEKEEILINDVAAVNRKKLETKRKPKKPTKIDRSVAFYMIEVALIEIGHERGDRRFTKQNIDALLGYNQKTMYNQRNSYNINIKTEGTIEYKLFTEVRGELANLTAHI